MGESHLLETLGVIIIAVAILVFFRGPVASMMQQSINATSERVDEMVFVETEAAEDGTEVESVESTQNTNTEVEVVEENVVNYNYDMDEPTVRHR